MIEIEIPKDILRFKTKLIGPFTARQFVCVALGAAVTFPAYMILKEYFIRDVVLLGVMLILAPFILCGFVTLYGLPFEKYAMIFIRNNFRAPTKRPYKTNNFYRDLIDNYDVDEDGNLVKIKENTAKDKLTNSKEKGKNKSYNKKKQVSSDPDLFSCM